jgi:dsRNA-specific ribonuclease
MSFIPGIYLGNRKDDFKTLIEGILKKTKTKQQYIDYLIDDTTCIDGNKTAFNLFGDAFTSESIDPVNNYQWAEQSGDLTANKFLVNYASNRFPQLRCSEGVKVLARVRINYGSKNSFSPIAEKLGFWPFISATCDERQRRKKSLLEDVLEAFLGTVEHIIDVVGFKGSKGYDLCCKILTYIFDEIKISIAYEDLFDSKTRLKEVFDMFGSEKLGELIYEENKDKLVSSSRAVMIKNGIPKKDYERKIIKKSDGSYLYDSIDKSKPVERIELGKGNASLKIDSEQLAASEALKTLSKMGYVKHSPALYSRFEKNVKSSPTKLSDVLKICGDEKNINEQIFTKGKSKHQTKYTSTALIHYCRHQNLEAMELCLKLGAKPNITDSDGLTATDVWIITSRDPIVLKKGLKLLNSFEEKLQVHTNISTKKKFVNLDTYIGIQIETTTKKSV